LCTNELLGYTVINDITEREVNIYMPNIQSAKKKMRKDVTRTKSNAVYLRAIENAIKGLMKLKGMADEKQVRKTVSLIDKAAKRKVFQKNKASRLKSRVTKLGAKKK
jgi:ribosomal protein S20